MRRRMISPTHGMLERLLIVGMGSIGSRHARLARELIPGLKIGALRRHGSVDLPSGLVDSCFFSLDEAIQFRPQAAVIASPATQHLEVALFLARAGVHLLVEKPISNTQQGVQEVIDTCQVQGVVLMTAYNLRFLPSLQAFRKTLVEGHIGRVLAIQAVVGQFLPSWRPEADYRQSVSARASLGGGVLLELSHEIDYLRWLCGEVQWVSAVLGKQSDLEIDVEDTAVLTLGFAAKDGANPVTASLNMDFIRHDSTRSCVAIGEVGSLRWDGISGTVGIFKKGASSWQTVFARTPQRDDSYVAEWEHFLDCVATGGTPLISGHDGLEAMKIVDAARISSAQKLVVEIGNK